MDAHMSLRSGRSAAPADPSGSSSGAEPTPDHAFKFAECSAELAASFAQHLFILAATIKQASGDPPPVDVESLKSSRLELLHLAEDFVASELAEFEKIKGKVEPGGAIESAMRAISSLSTSIGKKRQWDREPTDKLGTRLGHAHQVVEAGLRSVVERLSPESADLGVSRYTEKALRHRQADAAPNALQSSLDLKGKRPQGDYDDPPCLSEACQVEFTPEVLRCSGRLAIGGSGCSAGPSTSSRSRRSIVFATPRTPRATLSSDWDQVFSLVGPNLVPLLDGPTMGTVRLTCGAWRRMLDESQTGLMPLDLRAARLTALFPSLTGLNLSLASTSQMFPRDLALLAKAYGLQMRSLSLAHSALTSVHLPFLVKFRALTRLDLSRCALLGPSDVAALRYLLTPLLKSLSLAHCAMLDDGGLHRLAQGRKGEAGWALEQLQGPSRSSSQALPNKIPDTLALTEPPPPLGSLTELDLSGSRLLTHSGITSLAFSALATNLRSLRLRDCSEIGGEGLAAIAEGVPGLAELDLRGLHLLDDAALKQLRPLTSLEVLGVGSEKAFGTWLSILAQLPNLRNLSLRGCSEMLNGTFTEFFPDEQGAAVLPKLATLDLGFCSRLGEMDTWDKIASFPTLTDLDVSYTQTGGAEVNEWVGKMSLVRLSLEGCSRMNEQGLEACVSHKSLSHLNLRGCHSLGYYAIIALENAGLDFAH